MYLRFLLKARTCIQCRMETFSGLLLKVSVGRDFARRDFACATSPARLRPRAKWTSPAVSSPARTLQLRKQFITDLMRDFARHAAAQADPRSTGHDAVDLEPVLIVELIVAVDIEYGRVDTSTGGCIECNLSRDSTQVLRMCAQVKSAVEDQASRSCPDCRADLLVFTSPASGWMSHLVSASLVV